MTFTIEYEQEVDGRWLAEVVELAGVLAYGGSPQEAIGRVQALALRVLADRIEHGEVPAEMVDIGLLQHDIMAINKSKSSPHCFAAYRLANQALIRFTPDSFTSWMERFRILVPRQRRNRSQNAVTHCTSDRATAK